MSGEDGMINTVLQIYMKSYRGSKEAQSTTSGVRTDFMEACSGLELWGRHTVMTPAAKNTDLRFLCSVSTSSTPPLAS